MEIDIEALISFAPRPSETAWIPWISDPATTADRLFSHLATADTWTASCAKIDTDLQADLAQMQDWHRAPTLTCKT